MGKSTKSAAEVKSTSNEIAYPAGQRRILAVLAKAPLGRMAGAKLWEKAKLASRAWLSEYLGAQDSDNDGYICKAGKRTNVRKLVPAKLVRVIEDPELSGRVYEITAQGRKVLSKLQAAEEAK